MRLGASASILERHLKLEGGKYWLWRYGILFAETRISVFFYPLLAAFSFSPLPLKNILYYPSVASFITLRYSIYTFCILFYTDYSYFALLALSFHTIIYIYLSLVLGLGSSHIPSLLFLSSFFPHFIYFLFFYYFLPSIIFFFLFFSFNLIWVFKV